MVKYLRNYNNFLKEINFDHKHSIIFGIIISLILVMFIFFHNAFATEGTCAWHGGVECSLMADWDGSAICKDGWRDSSEMYFQMKECKIGRHYCTEDEAKQIDLIYNITKLGELITDISNQIIDVNTTALQQNLATYNEKGVAKIYIERKQAQIEKEREIKVLGLQSEYNMAQKNYWNARNQTDKECYVLGDKHYYEEQIDFLNQLSQQRQSSTQNNNSTVQNNAATTPVSPVPSPNTSQVTTQQSTSPVHINGYSLVKTSSNSDIYALYANTKRKIRSIDTFNSYDWANQKVTTVSQASLDSISDTKLIKTPDNPNVYILEKGFKRLLASVEIFNSYSLDWNKVVTMNQYEMDSYQIAPLIKYLDTYYWLDTQRVKHMFPSTESLATNGYSESDAIVINSLELGSYGEGIKINK